jgi:hypothetical protein
MAAMICDRIEGDWRGRTKEDDGLGKGRNGSNRARQKTLSACRHSKQKVGRMGGRRRETARKGEAHPGGGKQRKGDFFPGSIWGVKGRESEREAASSFPSLFALRPSLALVLCSVRMREEGKSMREREQEG